MCRDLISVRLSFPICSTEEGISFDESLGDARIDAENYSLIREEEDPDALKGRQQNGAGMSMFISNAEAKSEVKAPQKVAVAPQQRLLMDMVELANPDSEIIAALKPRRGPGPLGPLN